MVEIFLSFLLFLFFWLIAAIVCGIIASSKGRSGFGWFCIGLLIGIFGIILIACLPSIKPQTVVVQAAEGREQVKCPECAEFVLSEARKCKHCGAALTPTLITPPLTVAEIHAAEAVKQPRSTVLDRRYPGFAKRHA